MQNLYAWTDLTIRDVAIAYHKAKCDAFFERSVVISKEFAEYEKDLQANLTELLNRLHRGDAAEILNNHNNSYDIVPKNICWSPNSEPTTCGASRSATWFTSDGTRRFRRRIRDHAPSIELRICARFTVNAHIVGAIWINFIGQRLDAVLGPECYGSRVRRIHAPAGEVDRPNEARQYHLRARGSFEPYIHPYVRWRNDAMARTRVALAGGDRTLVLMLDLKGYYHSVDPNFAKSDGFRAFLAENVRPCLTKFEEDFTEIIAGSFADWGRRISSHLLGERLPHLGLPIGSAVARVLANLLLATWDRAVLCGLNPIHYGRYVDDMIIVLRDHDCRADEQKLFDFIKLRLSIPERSGTPVLTATDGEWHIDLGADFGATTKLTVQQKKLRIFSLEGQSGIDFLDTLDREARLVSSERRLLPEPEMLERTAAARVLTANEAPGDDADTFRRAGALSLRRFAWSVNLRNAEVLSRDLAPNEWTNERRQFYQFANDHLLCPDKLLDHVDAFTRLVGLAIACGDLDQAVGMIHQSRRSLDALGEAIDAVWQQSRLLSAWSPMSLNGQTAQVVNGLPTREKPWKELLVFFARTAEQAVLRAWSAAPQTGGRRGWVATPTAIEALQEALHVDGAGITGVLADNIDRMAQLVLQADLGRIALEQFLVPDLEESPSSLQSNGNSVPRCTADFLHSCFAADEQCSWVEEFVHATGAIGLPVGDSGQLDLTPFYFATRPVPAPKIARLIPDCVATAPDWCRSANTPGLRQPFSMQSPLTLWAGFVRALRGVACTVPNQSAPPASANPVVVLGGSAPIGGHLLALANMHLEEGWWSAAANGAPDTGKARLVRFARLVNSAIQAKPKPHYLVLPELSLPRRWVDSTAALLQQSGIALIAGVEYGYHPHVPATPPGNLGQVLNQAVICLVDQRLGFPYPVQLWQTKTHPAPREAQELHVKHGRTWHGGLGALAHPKDPKPVYVHNGLNLGILICSELQNINYRLAFQGQVDLLLILSWNQDLHTFEALTESAGFDVHAYIGVVNNGTIGDTRLRVPAKEPYLRDICRVRGGDNDYIVVARIDVESLREFQSRALNWPTSKDKYKPVPEGFVCSPRRRRTP
jgi:hypothetical protein